MTARSQPHADAREDPGIIILVGGQDPDYAITARLVATIASPPTSDRDPKWLELVRALSRVILHAHQQAAPDIFAQPLPYPAADLTFPLTRAEDLVSAAMIKMNRALGAAHAQMPALVRGVALSEGAPSAVNFGAWKHETSLADGSLRTMRGEQEFRDFLEQQGMSPPARFPEVHSAQAVVNFRNRVIAPFRPVFHLAAGLAMTLSDVERQLAADLAHQRKPPEACGFGRYPNGVQLLAYQVLLCPELAIAAIHRARRLEAGLPHLTAQRPKPSEVVRLRWRPVA